LQGDQAHGRNLCKGGHGVPLHIATIIGRFCQNPNGKM
jgi:hypothetical protein